MNMPLMSTPLGHINNDELARLVELWRGQFAYNQGESYGLTDAFFVEQSRRLWLGRFVTSENTFVAATQAW
jgi:hypothetical protein